ncbi:hypothetical protein ACGFX8_34340 [Streptomyces sp. NPDC048362]|uniref:hypothetical protein n=1 Tax=Streptomyces sp. NPDC048362 TaxID=3365539 RepID=UPI003721550A
MSIPPKRASAKMRYFLWMLDALLQDNEGKPTARPSSPDMPAIVSALGEEKRKEIQETARREKIDDVELRYFAARDAYQLFMGQRPPTPGEDWDDALAKWGSALKTDKWVMEKKWKIDFNEVFPGGKGEVTIDEMLTEIARRQSCMNWVSNELETKVIIPLTPR